LDKILEILNRIKPQMDFTKEQHLVDDGLLDSFDILTLISEINTDFEIDIKLSELSREHFSSVETIWSFVQHHLEHKL